jgi:hypothetical protein
MSFVNTISLIPLSCKKEGRLFIRAVKKERAKRFGKNYNREYNYSNETHLSGL